MESTESLRNRIQTARALQGVVRTMKGLAAVSIRQVEKSVEALTEYAKTIELGLQAVLRQAPTGWSDSMRPSIRTTIAIVFGSDQGMCGPLNRQIAEHALTWLRSAAVGPGRKMVMTVGARPTTELEIRGQDVARVFRAPNSVDGVAPAAREVLAGLEEWLSDQASPQVILFHHAPIGAIRYRPGTVALLSREGGWTRSLRQTPWPGRGLPTFAADREVLFRELIRQHILVVSQRALAESLACENMARLASMQAAERSIEERLVQLEQKFHQVRQAAITEELLDVCAGFEALKKPGARRRTKSDRSATARRSGSG